MRKDQEERHATLIPEVQIWATKAYDLPVKGHTDP